jgi:hypothetical protein
MTLTHIVRELEDIKQRLDELARRRAAAREVDEVRRRVTAIEEHLGIDKKIAVF